ncbi:N-carbamoylsarcosine amidohydrolase [Pseudonocardia ailaonensis]|uniref:N-carbamoylsarcosine amidohydrolase n=1 Tax=Pseudonocardia ailaonensis TaxID=367279 RepID=A0ABN2NN59_9PSEU
MGVHGGGTDRLYDAAGFGGAVRRGSRPAIVVVDLTRGFTETSYPTGADLTPVVDATARLVEAGRAAGAPIVWTTIGYTPAEMATVRWVHKVPALRALAADSAAVEVDPRLPVTEADHVIMKKGASGFFGTGLESVLTAVGADTVIVCGATTSGCVRATVVDALQYGYPTLVPRECVGDRAEGPHEAALFDIQAKYGDVIALDDALAALKGR